MAGDKTEQPTDKHLRDAREQGQVAKSQEVPSLAVVAACFLFIWLGFDWMVDEIKAFMLQAATCIGHPFEENLKNLTSAALRLFFLLSLPVVVLAAAMGVTGHLAQTGIIFAWKGATPKLDKLNPKQWFSKVFSLKNLLEFARSLLKIGVVIAVFYLVFADALPLLLRLPGHRLDAGLVATRLVLRQTAFYVLAAYAAVAAADLFLQRQLFLKDHMMSKEDVKNEYKEMEGDPHIKGQRKQLHQEMAMSDQLQGVRNADVLVTNPTHLAIALEYKEGKTPLPVILAKGEGAFAERMIREAERHGVPIMRNVPLAHDLYDQGRELSYVPSELIEPVAEVLIWLRELREGNNA